MDGCITCCYRHDNRTSGNSAGLSLPLAPPAARLADGLRFCRPARRRRGCLGQILQIEGGARLFAGGSHSAGRASRAIESGSRAANRGITCVYNQVSVGRGRSRKPLSARDPSSHDRDSNSWSRTGLFYLPPAAQRAAIAAAAHPQDRHQKLLDARRT